ncbi:hypothetical protein NQ152_16235 [Microbacterium sp. zg.B48]|uniref:hypothetical protein n=1 Tax=unclassified Microbacterium TaxID=2609290 RepID=UPI00214C091E|nr:MULTISPECIES: hypothetical protein [unclassified Microbacterium]MCR2765053.1 hypothetical protein [Microbacterium sp. zg.B48]MCR2811232.1 hypothetical protein [Microbacterium sp. zg.B185]WIM19831.1 hypothetical protein QNO12_03225 [Microbacterium sp. zg-B185]
MATLDELQTMLSVDGYSLSVETADGKTKAVISAGEGICEDCLVPKVVMTGLLAQALDVPAEQITLEYPEEH